MYSSILNDVKKPVTSPDEKYSLKTKQFDKLEWNAIDIINNQKIK